MTDYESKCWRAVATACQDHDMEREQVLDLGDKRHRTTAARKDAICEASKLGVPNPEIARFFGVDQTTVKHHLSRAGLSRFDKGCRHVPKPEAPIIPDLPANEDGWSAIDRMKAMAHAENRAMRAR